MISSWASEACVTRQTSAGCLGRTVLCDSLLHAGADRPVLVLLAVPEHGRNRTFPFPRFFRVDGRDSSLVLGQFLQSDLLEGKINDDKLRLGGGGPPSLGA